jgi:hypothetical protein
MINLEIPEQLIIKDSGEIRYELINGKTIIGLCGYARSGKDTLGSLLVERLSFKRISFADTLKKELNEHMKLSVFNDLQEKGFYIDFESVDFENPKKIEIKELLRPYMIWYGEEIKKINGIHYWTNKAFSQIDKNDKKIVITDVRRLNELDIFKNSRTFIEKRIKNRREISLPEDSPYDIYDYDSDFETLFLYINQLNNSDSDSLTKETIMSSLEKWLFDEIVEIDSRIQNPEFQKRHLINHIQKLIIKYPKYFI